MFMSLSVLALAGSRFGLWGLVLAGLTGVAGFALVLLGEAGDPNRLYVFQHVGINIVLCAWFGGSLRAGRLSLIGQFAQRVHPLTPDMVRYTTQVTRVWSLYFAVMAVTSLAVYASLSFGAWSVLANLLTPLSVASLFLGEHLMRYRLHPEFERTRLMDALRACYGAPVARTTATKMGDSA